MKISTFSASQSQDVINLFTEVFSDSEGRDEGESIGSLVSDLIRTTAEHDILGFVAVLEEEIVGCVFFTRLRLPSGKVAFILSPVAIVTEQQGKGVGQQLIRQGIEELRFKQVDLVFTYGDPAFYSKVGFQQVSEDIVKAPLKLTQPEGWLAQPLQSGVMITVEDSSECVNALNKQEYW
ncbi:GNAT family N-acetyltransferase [Amphritea sp. HPY]|uniref:GNAT family N-acetyltransferase n=1 Tax=Amphritea sp. HPY TaxID=3421652 RepID=UPI003D7E6C3D